jgi:glycerophosphoryl diester phosphodiesterase
MRREVNTEFFDPVRPRAIAHRGASGRYPENTMAAFKAARDLGVPYIELDVHMTRDGEIVVIHDEDLRRIAGHEGTIREMTFAEVAAADAGYSFAVNGNFPFRGAGLHVPRLVDVLTAFRECRFIIEVKQTTPQLAEAMLKAVERAKMRRRILVASEHHAPLDQVRAIAPDIPTSFSSTEVQSLLQSLVPGGEPCRTGGDALEIPPEYYSWKFVTPESVSAAHQLGVEVHVWTVNAQHEMREMLALGVDGIMTDYPERLLALLSA